MSEIVMPQLNYPKKQEIIFDENKMSVFPYEDAGFSPEQEKQMHQKRLALLKKIKKNVNKPYKLPNSQVQKPNFESKNFPIFAKSFKQQSSQKNQPLFAEQEIFDSPFFKPQEAPLQNDFQLESFSLQPIKKMSLDYSTDESQDISLNQQQESLCNKKIKDSYQKFSNQKPKSKFSNVNNFAEDCF